jgi:rhodanese-related sulfurtransferase
MSPLAARKAEKLGYKNVKVFHAGLPEWKKAGRIVTSNIAAIENYNKTEASYILIDLRPAKDVEQGHIPNAVAMADGGLDKMKEQFPTHMAAPIVLYNQDGAVASAEDAFKKVSGWGYKQVSVLSGGFAGWEKAGKQTAKGPAESKIKYVRKLQPGEIDIVAFKEMVIKPPAGTFILDVRTPKEATDGLLPNAVNIPMEQLEQRLPEVPKGKNLLVHCSTGIRAEMAYNVLKKAGYDAKYVRAKVEFDPEKKGKYTIEE